MNKEKDVLIEIYDNGALVKHRCDSQFTIKDLLQRNIYILICGSL